MIDLTEYQQQIRQFYTPEVAADLLTYSREALVAEVGEVVGLRAKRRRGDAALQDAAAYREAVVLEMGDVLFSLASIWTATAIPANIGLVPTPNVTLEKINRIVGYVLETNASRVICDELFWALWAYTTSEQLDIATIGNITRANIAKLTARQAAGTIRGSGDNR